MSKAEGKNGSLLAGILLVAGTAIGGGMLALPVLTCEGGFWPTTLFLFLSWLFMASTGHLLMETLLRFPGEVNITTLAKHTLGRGGLIAAWVLYLFLFYSLTTAYLTGGGNLIGYAFTQMPKEVTPLIFFLLFAPIVILGARVVDRVNGLFVWGLILSFLIFLVLGLPYINLAQLKRASFCPALLALPVVFTSFGYQGIVPTLTYYFKRDARRTTIAIWVGSLIPFLIYLIWEALILGVIPLDGLMAAKKIEETAVYPLKDCLQIPGLFQVGKIFAFFAIVTSFFGVTLGLVDFLSDGLHLRKKGKNIIYIHLLVFGPPLLASLINPCLFLTALLYAGGLGSALLLGLLPILMAWKNRAGFGITPYALPGGIITLSLLLLFVLTELTITILLLFK